MRIFIFQHEPGGAGRDRVEDSAILVERRHHQERWPGALERSDNGDPIHPRHPNIAEHNVWVDAGNRASDFIAVTAPAHDIDVGGSTEQGGEPVGRHRIVVDDEYADAVRVGHIGESSGGRSATGPVKGAVATAARQ